MKIPRRGPKGGPGGPSPARPCVPRERLREPGLERSRLRLLENIRREGVPDAVLDAIAQTPREEFVPDSYRNDAYRDVALPTAAGQTISQPSLVAKMVALLEAQPTHRVLEVGAGSGYQAAVLSYLAASVVSVERIPALALAARRRLERLGYGNCRIEQAREVLGWPDGAPFDGIIVAAAAPSVPDELYRQLAPGGRMVIPVGGRGGQQLLVVIRGRFGRKVQRLFRCAFVPLIGPDAWPEDGAWR